MRFAIVAILAIAACTTNDHSISGTYSTNFDGPPVILSDGSEVGSSVVRVTVHDADGVLDDEYFHSDSVVGPFSTTVADALTDVYVNIVQETMDGEHDEVDYLIEGPIDSDVDLGMVVLSQ